MNDTQKRQYDAAKPPKVLAIDFDGCLCDNAYPAIGAPHWDVINAAKARRADGWAIILWTCRIGQYLADAVNACREWGLDLDAVNENHPTWVALYDNNTRKIGATEYWDDRAVTMPAK